VELIPYFFEKIPKDGLDLISKEKFIFLSWIKPGEIHSCLDVLFGFHRLQIALKLQSRAKRQNKSSDYIRQN